MQPHFKLGVNRLFFAKRLCQDLRKLKMGHYEKQGLRRAIAAAPLGSPHQEAFAYESRFAANRAHGHHWMLVGWCAAEHVAISGVAAGYVSDAARRLKGSDELAHVRRGLHFTAE